jgi:putative SOS response-associated peptidase YedK
VFLKEIHRFRGEKQGNSRFIKYLYRKVKFLLRRERGPATTVAGLKDYNQTLISSKDMTVLTTKVHKTLKSIESIKEKDLKLLECKMR